MEEEKKELLIKKKHFSFSNDIPIHIDMKKVFWIYACLVLVIIPIIPSYGDNLLYPVYLSNYHKSIIVICLTVLFGLLELLFADFKKKIHFKDISILSLAIGTFYLLVLISAACSEFSESSIFGVYGRNEGLLIILAYFGILKIFEKHFTLNMKFFKVLCLGVCILSLIAIYQVTIRPYLFANLGFYGIMGWSTMGNPNFYSAYMSMMLPLMIFAYLKTEKFNWEFLIATSIAFGGFIVSKTSSGYIAFVIYISIALVYLIIKKMNIKKLAILIVCFVVMFLLLNIVNNFTYLKEFVSIKSNTIEAESFETAGSNRGKIYLMVLDIIKDNPIVGIGVDCLGKYTTKYYTYEELTFGSNVGVLDKAHCEYLHIAASYGIPALIAYLAIILIVAYTLLKSYLKNTSNYALFAIGIAIAIYLIQATVNIATIQVSPTFFALMGAGLSLSKKA